MHETIKKWVLKSGFEAQILYVNESHLCGYVRIPKGHPLYNHPYFEKSPFLLPLRDIESIGKRGVMPVLSAVLSGEIEFTSPDTVFDVHGGITFSGKLPDEEGFWYGFDCAHAGDRTKDSFLETDVWRDEEYVTEECESLGQQLLDRVVSPLREEEEDERE